MERPYIDAARNQSCINNDAYSGIVVHSSNIRRVDEQVEKEEWVPIVNDMVVKRWDRYVCCV